MRGIFKTAHKVGFQCFKGFKTLSTTSSALQAERVYVKTVENQSFNNFIKKKDNTL